MKNVVILFAFSFIGTIACAQQVKSFDSLTRARGKDTARVIRICVPSKGTLFKPPLYVFRSHNRRFVSVGDSLALNVINPSWIETINVIKERWATDRYGDAGKNGVIDITLKPEAHRMLKQLLKDGKVREVK